MPAFSFLHCADLHLGAPFQGLADLPPELGARLREAPTAALGRIVAAAVERRVDAVIIAGDLFDAADRNLRAQIQLRDGLRRLDEAAIPTLIAAGNHDPLGTAVPSISYPDSVHFFDTEVQAVPLVRDGDVLAHVYGVSYGSAEVEENLAQRFPSRPDGPFSIGVLHTNAGDRSGHAAYAPCTLADLEERSFDYWALGHVHTRETLRAERPIVHYPGNTQGLHMRETGPRGVTLVEVASGGAVRMKPLWTDTVRWHRVRTPIDQLATLDDVMAAYAETCAEVAAAAPDRLHLILWTLTGQGGMHAELRRPGLAGDLVETLRNEHAPEALPGAVWLQRLDLATRPARDLEELRKQPDLLGDLLRLAERARRAAPKLGPSAVGSDVDLAPEDEVSAAIKERLTELFDEARLTAVLGHSAWETLEWQRLIRRAEAVAVEGLLPTDEAES